MDEQGEIKIGSGNVFADLGFPNPKEHRVKANLVYKIGEVMKERGLTQVQTAELIGMAQGDVSKMLRGQFRLVSVERLMEILVALGHDVDIVVRPRRDDPNHAAQLNVA